MKTVIKIICFPIDYFLIGLVWVYKIFISPLLTKTCAYSPSCSSYMIEAIKEYHFIKGVRLGLKRLARCSPKHKGCYDPVPVNIKGDIKWIL